MNMVEFVAKNVAHLSPLIACAFSAILIVVERARALFWVYVLNDPKEFYDRIRNLILEDRISEAISICDRYRKKPVAQVVREGLLRIHQPEEIIQDGLDIAASEAMDRVKARTGYLSMVANVSTLLGLIGTILGLIQSFEAVGAADAQSRSALLAQGISTAMNHTLWGLAVAVPCMVFFSLLMNKTNRLRSEVDRAVVRTMDFVRQRQAMGAVLKRKAQ